MKKASILALVFSLVLLAAVATVSAIPVTVQQVRIDGTDVDPDSDLRLDLQRGEEFDVKILLSSDVDDIENVQVQAEVFGLEHRSDAIVDTTETFDMEANVTYTKRLTLSLPERADEDDYKIRLTIADRYGDETILNYNVKIDVPRHSVTIRDVVFSPEGSVQAGRALLATVRVKNSGESQEDDLKVRVAIPALGIGASDFIDEVDSEKTTTSEELFLRIPACAEAGVYDVRVDVEFNDGEDSVSATEQIEVVDSDTCPIKTELEGKVTITVSGETQQVSAGGAGAVYPVSISNSGSTSKSFVLSVDGVGTWGSSRVSPSNVITVGGGETKSAFVFVTANAGASAGEKMFVVSVEDAAGNKLQDISLKATVSSGSAVGDLGGARRALEVGLVVLVVLIVLVGLVVALRRMRGPGGDGEESQTYY